VLNAMGDTLDTIVDITLVYPDGRGELVDLFADRIPEVRVHIRQLAIPERFRGGDYASDDNYRAEFQRWLNELWQHKDSTVQRLLQQKPGQSGSDPINPA